MRRLGARLSLLNELRGAAGSFPDVARRLAALEARLLEVEHPATITVVRTHRPEVPDPEHDAEVARLEALHPETLIVEVTSYGCGCAACSVITEREAEAAEQAAEEGARRAAAAIAASAARDVPFTPPARPRASETTLEASWAPLAAREVRGVPWHVHGSWLSDGSCGVVPGCPYRSGLVRSSESTEPTFGVASDSIQLGLRDAPSGPSLAGPLGVQP